MLVNVLVGYLLVGFVIGVAMYSTVRMKVKTKVALIVLMTFFWFPIIVVALLAAAYIHYGKVRDIFD